MADAGSASDEDGTLSPDEAFALLGDETRVAILRALWEAHDPFAGDDAVSFSDLRERVGDVDSARFNYHLDRLTGHFVDRTDDGYELRRKGLAFVYAIVAGTANEDPVLEPRAVDVSCPMCGARTTVRYEDEYLYHVCTECDGHATAVDDFPRGTLSIHPLSPAGLTDRDPGEALRAARTVAKHRRAMVIEGVCPECTAAIDTRVRVCEDHDAADGPCDECGGSEPTTVECACSTCKFAWRLGVGLTVATHPAVVGFHYEHGIEFDAADPDAAARIREWETSLVAADPLEIRVTIPLDDDALELTLDEDLDVVDVRETTDT